MTDIVHIIITHAKYTPIHTHYTRTHRRISLLSTKLHQSVRQ